jgi:ElaB/YqjD/DUF883 family membrane-anchored ribosome-binding protein
MAHSTQYPSEAGKTARDLGDKASRQFDKVTDQVEDAVKSIAERGREVGGEVQAVAGNIKSAVNTSVKDQPMATLGVAVAVGFILGALWKS